MSKLDKKQLAQIRYELKRKLDSMADVKIAENLERPLRPGDRISIKLSYSININKGVEPGTMLLFE